MVEQALQGKVLTVVTALLTTTMLRQDITVLPVVAEAQALKAKLETVEVSILMAVVV